MKWRWQPIETAPKDGTKVLVFGHLLLDPSETPISYIEVCPFYRGKWTIEWMERHGPPSYWMPLPEPPGAFHAS